MIVIIIIIRLVLHEWNGRTLTTKMKHSIKYEEIRLPS